MNRIIFILIMGVMAGSLAVYGSTELSPRLTAVGTLSASNLYLSYLSISTIADGFIKNNYNARITNDILQEILFLNESSQFSLRNLLENNSISQEDWNIAQEIIRAYDQLNDMAHYFIDFLKGRSDETTYQIVRDMTWKTISSLLNN